MKQGLQQLFPKETRIKFPNIDKELTVNPITLSDDSWLLHEFGGAEGLMRVFETGDLRSLIRIFYRLLSNEDKQYLSEKIELEVYDEEGNKKQIKSNIDKLAYLLDIQQFKPISDALIRARGASLPEVEEVATIDGEQPEKKKKAKK